MMIAQKTNFSVNFARGTGYESGVNSGVLSLDKDMIYLCTDSRRVYMNSVEYTHPSLLVDEISDPNEFFSEDYRKSHSNSVVIDLSNHVGYVIDSTGHYDIKSVIDVSQNDISSSRNGNVVVSVSSPSPGQITLTLNHVYDLVREEVGVDITEASNALQRLLTGVIDSLGRSATTYNSTAGVDKDHCTLTSISYDDSTHTFSFTYSKISISYTQIADLSDKLDEYLTLEKFEKFLGTDSGEMPDRSFSEMDSALSFLEDQFLTNSIHYYPSASSPSDIKTPRTGDVYTDSSGVTYVRLHTQPDTWEVLGTTYADQAITGVKLGTNPEALATDPSDHSVTIPVMTDTEFGTAKIGHEQVTTDHPVTLDGDSNLKVDLPDVTHSIYLGDGVAPITPDAAGNTSIPAASSSEYGVVKAQEAPEGTNLSDVFINNEGFLQVSRATGVSSVNGYEPDYYGNVDLPVMARSTLGLGKAAPYYGSFSGTYNFQYGSDEDIQEAQVNVSHTSEGYVISGEGDQFGYTEITVSISVDDGGYAAGNRGSNPEVILQHEQMSEYDGQVKQVTVEFRLSSGDTASTSFNLVMLGKFDESSLSEVQVDSFGKLYSSGSSGGGSVDLVDTYSASGPFEHDKAATPNYVKTFIDNLVIDDGNIDGE